MKTQARVVIIGGGMMGIGLAYYLTKEGWSDVVIVEKGELTSGSTWHAAGLIPHFIGSLNMAKVHYCSTELYKTLEAETGQATGWHGCGSIRLATNQDEVDWFHYVQGVLKLVGAECHLIGPNEIKNLAPILDMEGVLLGAYTPGDGHTDPSSTANAMAIGARKGGCEIYRHTRVTDINRLPGGEWEVVTDKGNIACEHVVNAAGCYGPQVGAMVGLGVPIINMIHQYLVTENMPEVEALSRELPVIRDPRSSCYYRQEQRGIIIGPYETQNAEAWGLDGVDWGFDMELLPPDLDRLEPHLELALARIPSFGNAGIKRVVSGPITHTPDGGFLLGPAAGIKNYWMCCGASIGITQGAGAGKYLAQWMVHGQTEINVREMDPRRYGHFAPGEHALAKSIDEYEHMYKVHYPGEHRDAGRPVRTTPIYETLKAQGAIFADVYGWERAKWFAKPGQEEEYSFRRTNWFEPVGEECRAVAERVGVLDLSSFAKYEVTGSDAEALLSRLSANRIPRRDGGVALVHMLTSLGGIESEMTITRLAEGKYFVLSGAVAELHDLDWLTQAVREGEDVQIKNVTEDYGTLVLTGPRSRDVLTKLTDADLTNASFRWLTAQEIEVAGVPTRALRVSYVGELGWELHHPMGQMATLYEAIMQAGEEFGIANFGTYAVNSLRLEKAYRAWGGELTTEISPLEAGLDRFIDKSKQDFVGQANLKERQEKGLHTKLVYMQVDVADADPLGNEPVYDGERVIGVTTAGAYGHRVQKVLGFAYVEPDYAEVGTSFEIAILGERRKATVIDEPAYDPENARLRA